MAYGPRTLASLCRHNVQQDILNRFVHRFTIEHVPARALKPTHKGKYYAPQYSSDREWLSNTVVNTRRDGELDGGHSYCEARNPSWPLGQWLDAPFKKEIAR